jgi:hypothetical protein
VVERGREAATPMTSDGGVTRLVIEADALAGLVALRTLDAFPAWLRTLDAFPAW